MHNSMLGVTMCYVHIWFFDMCLKENGLELKILRITYKISHQLSDMVRVLLMYGL
jgi:hypothetical protein